MALDRAVDDALVAAGAGGATVAVALASSVAPTLSVETLPTLAPLGVYAVYLFSRKGGPYGSLDTPRNWALAAVVVAVVVLGTAAV